MAGPEKTTRRFSQRSLCGLRTKIYADACTRRSFYPEVLHRCLYAGPFARKHTDDLYTQTRLDTAAFTKRSLYTDMTEELLHTGAFTLCPSISFYLSIYLARILCFIVGSPFIFLSMNPVISMSLCLPVIFPAVYRYSNLPVYPSILSSIPCLSLKL